MVTCYSGRPAEIKEIFLILNKKCLPNGKDCNSLILKYFKNLTINLSKVSDAPVFFAYVNSFLLTIFSVIYKKLTQRFTTGFF